MVCTRASRIGPQLQPWKSPLQAPTRNISVRGPAFLRQASSTSTPGEGQNTEKRKKNYKPRKVIYSGIQPTGVPHLGNYLGALRQWKQFQDDKTRPKNPENYQLIYSIVDLHALTHPQNPHELLKRRQETFASLLAIGLDPRHSIIYFQSMISGHARLMWYLSNVASTGYLSRMTQWKSKLGVSEDATLEDKAAREKLRLGLFSYPVLQAADILLFRANIVPVGEDQEQHVEFARNLAKSFNSQYRESNGGQDFFAIPKASISPAKRIMSLKDPTTKMSKSHPDPKTRILITDSPDDIRNKLKVALTDSIGGISYDPEKRPGVSNLIEMLKHVTNSTTTCEEIAADHANQSLGALKGHVAEEIIKALAGIREKFMDLMDPTNDTLGKLIGDSVHLPRSISGKNIARIENLMGLGNSFEVPHALTKSDQAKKQAVIHEQEELENEDVEEPDVTPQRKEGVDIPIAS